MNLRNAVVVFALLGAASAAMAQEEMFIPPDTDGCQTYAPFVWTELRPGGTWQAMVDLSACATDQLGSYYYFGYIARRSRADKLQGRDDVVVKVSDLGAGQEYTSGAGSNGEESIHVTVARPGLFLLTAENHGHATVKIRLTWTREGS